MTNQQFGLTQAYQRAGPDLHPALLFDLCVEQL